MLWPSSCKWNHTKCSVVITRAVLLKAVVLKLQSHPATFIRGSSYLWNVKQVATKKLLSTLLLFFQNAEPACAAKRLRNTARSVESPTAMLRSPLSKQCYELALGSLHILGFFPFPCDAMTSASCITCRECLSCVPNIVLLLINWVGEGMKYLGWICVDSPGLPSKGSLIIRLLKRKKVLSTSRLEISNGMS